MHLSRCALFLGFARLPLCLQAQFNSSIEGTITDSSGAVVPAAKITVTNLETGVSRNTTTSGDGFYRLVNLGLGRYTVSVEHPRFPPAAPPHVRLAAAE